MTSFPFIETHPCAVSVRTEVIGVSVATSVHEHLALSGYFVVEVAVVGLKTQALVDVLQAS